MWHVWREGMQAWRRAYEVQEIKQVIMEGRGEVLDEVVQEYVKNLTNKKPADKKEEENSADKAGEDPSQDNDDLYYFSKQEGAYKVFDPRSKTWSLNSEKPS